MPARLSQWLERQPILLLPNFGIRVRFIAVLPKYQPLDRITFAWTPDYA
jgi:hypothetical protein